jgi:hypothetical protein
MTYRKKCAVSHCGTRPTKLNAAAGLRPWTRDGGRIFLGGITRGDSAKRFETPHVGGAGWVLAAWGPPSHPGFSPFGETGKGGFCRNYFACSSSTAAMRV